jgi:hypothetical protein
LNTAPTVPLADVPLVIPGGLTKGFTETFTDVLTALYRVTSVGVKVTDCEDVPTLGTLDGELKANVPATDAEPPVNEPEASDCPNVITEAVGWVRIEGVALLTAKLVVTSGAEL